LTGRSGLKTGSIRRSPVFKIKGRRITAGRSNAPAISASRLPFPAGKQLRAAQTGEASVVFQTARHPETIETGNPDTKKAAPGGCRAASLGGITKIRHAMPPVSSAESSSLKAAKAEKLRPANGRLLRQGNGLSLSGIRPVFLPPIRPVSPARPEAAASADRQTGR
jgi:hypothetical protein